MEKIEIKFDFLDEEIYYLGLAANYLNVLWSDFISLAVDEKIEWVLNYANEEEIELKKKHPEIKLAIMDYKKPLNPPHTLSFNFPQEKLILLEKASNKLDLKREEFIGCALLKKIEETEDKAYLEKKKLGENVPAQNRKKSRKKGLCLQEK